VELIDLDVESCHRHYSLYPRDRDSAELEFVESIYSYATVAIPFTHNAVAEIWRDPTSMFPDALICADSSMVLIGSSYEQLSREHICVCPIQGLHQVASRFFLEFLTSGVL
jgi:hypothetical protein